MKFNDKEHVMKINAKTWKRIAPMLAIDVLLAVAMIIPAYAHDHRDSPDVFPRDSVIFGRTYGEWSAAWHQWSDSMPTTKHPLFNSADCAEGQSGPVWFLGGSYQSAVEHRTCTVPVGKALYFPVLNIECLDVEASNGACLNATEPIFTKMRSELATIIDPAFDLEVTVDGKRVRNLKKDFRVQSTVYPIITVEGGLFEFFGEGDFVLPLTTYHGVDDGIYVMLEPLPKGKHTLRFKGSSIFLGSPFSLDITYDITVQ
jgi:hypothetical protein